MLQKLSYFDSLFSDYGAHLEQGRFGPTLVLEANVGNTGSPEVRYEITAEGLPVRNGFLVPWEEVPREGPFEVWLAKLRGEVDP